MERKRQGWIRRIVPAVLCLLLLSASAGAEDRETVRVGLCRRAGYHTVDEHGNHSGYDYEYLMKIASCTGWTYEFVEGTQEECIAMLERGEIDLLGGVEKRSERLETMCFADMPSMYAAGCLMQTETAGRYSYEDFVGFNGMRVGTLRDAPLADALARYSREHGFTYTLERYETEAELSDALERGEIDSIYLTDNRDLDAYTVLAHFGFSPFYYVTSLARPELATQLDDALRAIHAQDHYYESKLDDKYFHAVQNIAFTRAEQAYIGRGLPVQVGVYRAVGDLFCRYDEERDQYVGIAIDALALLSERTGLTFVYEEIPEGMSPKEFLAARPNTVAAPSFLNSLMSYSDDTTFLDLIMKGRMLAVSRQEESVDLDEAFRLAIPGGDFCAQGRVRQIFPRAEVIPCMTHREGLELVRSGAADMALVNEVTGAYLLHSPYFQSMKMTQVGTISEDLTLALNTASDPELISILNKGITSLSDRDIQQIVVNSTAASFYRMSTGEWLYRYKPVLLLSAAVVLGAVCFTWKVWEQKKRSAQDRQRLLLAEERHKADLEYREKMFRQANFDKLTGLYNENYFLEKANQRLREDPDTVYTFLRINLKRFKMTNELYGAKVGDAVLREMADDLRFRVGKKGVYGRLYADQFAVCMVMDQADLEKMAEECVRFLEYDGQRVRVEMIVGVYVDDRQCRDASQALDYAQIALLNRAKPGEERFRYFRDSYLESMLRSQRITNEMEQALREEQFRVFFQPQYDLNDQKLVGAEALVRWDHPQVGMIPPDQFIPVFESNGFIYRLDAYVCERVCRLLARWREKGKLVPVSINLSRADLGAPELIPMLRGNLEKYGVPIQYLHLEITESAYVKDQEKAANVIGELRKAGFCIEMDDFGSGYSSLNMLKDVPVDVLKMDMRFFDGERHMDKGGNIIKAIVSMAHSLGILVIAEGVETEREVNFLRSIRCGVGQGYLYGRPMSVELFEARLSADEVGEKRLATGEEDSISDLYWKMEKYGILLRSDRVTLFDYDPDRDRAVLTSVDEEGRRRERTVERCVELLSVDIHIHPEDRGRLEELLRSGTLPKEELDFQADSEGMGSFTWYHAVAYRYKRGGSRSRVIAIIRKRDPEDRS